MIKGCDNWTCQWNDCLIRSSHSSHNYSSFVLHIASFPSNSDLPIHLATVAVTEVMNSFNAYFFLVIRARSRLPAHVVSIYETQN